MKTRRPIAATRCVALPSIERLAAGIALGSVAIAGCKNPFDVTQIATAAESAQAPFDPAAGLASLFATTSIRTQAEPHPTYPLISVLAAQAARFAHQADPPVVPPPPVTATTTTVGTSFMGGAMAIASPRPLPRHVRGGVRSVGP